jgi:hypothetical protein
MKIAKVVNPAQLVLSLPKGGGSKSVRKEPDSRSPASAEAKLCGEERAEVIFSGSGETP